MATIVLQRGMSAVSRLGDLHDPEAAPVLHQFRGRAVRGHEAEHPGLELLQPRHPLRMRGDQRLPVLPRPLLGAPDHLELLLQRHDLLTLPLPTIASCDLQKIES